MAHRYFPHTPEDLKEMLDSCGVRTPGDLYADVPDSLRLKHPYDLPEEMSEKEVRDFFASLAAKNRPLTCFAGAGYYDHFAPAAVNSIISRSEFLTAYTPYQPEISQGTLQYIFEYQSIMAMLTGLDVSNASMYDGATATAEAMVMAVSHARKRNRVLVSATLNPSVRKVMDTYARYRGITLDTIPAEDGTTSVKALEAMLAQGDVAGVVLATPNYYGILEDLTGVADMCHNAKALLILNCRATALSVIKSPGEWGADIACGDAQSLGFPLNYGGPYLGFLCCTKALMRKLPGRIVGATVDREGRRSFVLTLQAREQHIRREKATSNICSNQGLMALYVAAYTALLGPQGLREINEQGASGARYLATGLEKCGAMKLTYPSAPFLDEFLMTASIDLDELQRRCLDAGILPGVRTDADKMLIAVTEMQTLKEIDRYISIAESLTK